MITRRNFIQAIGAGLAALLTRRIPQCAPDVEPHNDGPDFWIIGDANGERVSTDGGETWIKLPSILQDDDETWMSEDSGATWVLIEPPQIKLDGWQYSRGGSEGVTYDN